MPRSFFGVVSQAGLNGRDFQNMRAGHVGSLRVPIQWDQVERRRGVYDWSDTDALVAATARAGVKLRPFLYGSPRWIASAPAHPPLRSKAAREAWKSFLRKVVKRYGRGGSFWAGRTHRKPVTHWQIWNEPNFDFYWLPKPSPRDYARLLRLSARAIRSQDQHATIVLGGVAWVHDGMDPRTFLRAMYRVKGIRRSFDQVALHPYAPRVRDMKYEVSLIRRVMARANDARTPLAITELGWASGGPPGAPLVTTPRGQARRLKGAFKSLSRHQKDWRLSGVSWFAWQDIRKNPDKGCIFCRHAGLFTVDGDAKPAWRAFKRFSIR